MVKRILVIDDDSSVSGLLHTQLTAEGFEVAVTSLGEEGFATATENPPSLIMLDVNLPDATGFQLVGRFRAHPATREVPIIMMSGAARWHTQQSVGKSMGASEYILKPFDINDVTQKVNALVKGRPDLVPINPGPPSAGMPTRAVSTAPDVVGPSLNGLPPASSITLSGIPGEVKPSLELSGLSLGPTALPEPARETVSAPSWPKRSTVPTAINQGLSTPPAGATEPQSPQWPAPESPGMIKATKPSPKDALSPLQDPFPYLNGDTPAAPLKEESLPGVEHFISMLPVDAKTPLSNPEFPAAKHGLLTPPLGAPLTSKPRPPAAKEVSSFSPFFDSKVAKTDGETPFIPALTPPSTQQTPQSLFFEPLVIPEPPPEPPSLPAQSLFAPTVDPTPIPLPLIEPQDLSQLSVPRAISGPVAQNVGPLEFFQKSKPSEVTPEEPRPWPVPAPAFPPPVSELAPPTTEIPIQLSDRSQTVEGEAQPKVELPISDPELVKSDLSEPFSRPENETLHAVAPPYSSIGQPLAPVSSPPVIPEFSNIESGYEEPKLYQAQPQLLPEPEPGGAVPSVEVHELPDLQGPRPGAQQTFFQRVPMKPVLALLCLGAALLTAKFFFSKGAVTASVATVAGAGTLSEPAHLSISGHVLPGKTESVSSKFAGPVTAKRFEVGQKVAKGDVLITGGKVSDAGDRRIARRALTAAQRELNSASKELADTESLPADLITPESLSKERKRAARARERLETAKAQVAETGHSGGGEVRSPLTGVVLKDLLGDRNAVTAGAPIAEISSGNGMLYRATVSGSAGSRIKVGQSAQVRIPGRPESLAATVSDIHSYIETSVIKTEASLQFADPSQAASSGMSDAEADIAIGGGTTESQITVPKTALFTRGGKVYVWGVNSVNQLTLREVAMGATVGNDVQITRGLSAGDKYCPTASPNFTPGARVRASADF